jgi:THO complex subunit 2
MISHVSLMCTVGSAVLCCELVFTFPVFTSLHVIFTTFSSVVVHANAPYIKMVSEQFDRCHGQLLQYVEFLTSAVSPVLAYAQLIPSLDDLIHKYHLEPEVSLSP